MRVLILTNSDAGLYHFRKELIEELIHPGTYIENREAEPCQVYLALPDGEFIPDLKKMGCQFINTAVDRRGMNPVKDLKLFVQYRAISKKVNPDIVLTYTIKPNIYGGIVSKSARIPYISNITGLGTSIENKSYMSKIILYMYKVGIRNADTVFFQNATNKHLFEEKGLIENQGFLIPGSGVNLIKHCLEPYPDEQEQIKFLFIGRIMKDKGIEEYLDCAECVSKKYPNAKFSMIGFYDEEEYKSRVDELRTRGIIQYYGQQKNVHTFIKEHHAVILPSYHEGLSNVLLEGAATGRPVLASNVPGCRETFDDGITGIGFAPRSSQALIAAVEKFIAMPYEERRDMGSKAREKVEKEFDRKLVIKAYLDAIKNSLGERKNVTL